MAFTCDSLIPVVIAMSVTEAPASCARRIAASRSTMASRTWRAIEPATNRASDAEDVVSSVMPHMLPASGDQRRPDGHQALAVSALLGLDDSDRLVVRCAVERIRSSNAGGKRGAPAHRMPPTRVPRPRN
jgi:hypothetical protein